MTKSYMEQLLYIATYRPEDNSESPEAIRQGIKVGFIFLIIFIISIICYKLFFPHIALF
jgi:hypothetical protein